MSFPEWWQRYAQTLKGKDDRHLATLEKVAKEAWYAALAETIKNQSKGNT